LSPLGISGGVLPGVCMDESLHEPVFTPSVLVYTRKLAAEIIAPINTPTMNKIIFPLTAFSVVFP
jgi:hypothetical protein